MNWIDGATMAEPWKPVWVQRDESERDGYVQERNKHHEMIREYDKKIAEIDERLSRWNNPEAAE